MRYQSESGNALWFIMVAIVLIGILTAVLSRGSNTVDQTGSYEHGRIEVSQILRYAKSIETAVQQMTLNGISESDISFQNETTTADYTNNNCNDTADRSYPDCLVFEEQGAGLTYQNFPDASSSDWIFTGNLRAGDIGGDSTISELLMILPNVSKSLCIAINNELGVDNPSGNPPQDQANSSPGAHFQGQYTNANLIASTGSTLSYVAAACYEGGGTPAAGTYHFYQVLIPR